MESPKFQLVAEAVENNLDDNRWHRWYACGLCEQYYHGVVRCALGWACWKTYVGRPETDMTRRLAMTQLGNGLFDAAHYEDTVSVKEAELAMERRLGASVGTILAVQANLATVYERLGRSKEKPSLRIRRDVYLGYLKLYGEEHGKTLEAASNYASTLHTLKRHGEAKALLKKAIPVAQRVLGTSHDFMFRMKGCYAEALFMDAAATRDDLREAVETYEDTRRIARRVLGSAHPLAAQIEQSLLDARRKQRPA